MDLCSDRSDRPYECRPYWPNLKSVALPVPEIVAIGVFGGEGGLRTSNVGKGLVGGLESSEWYSSKERW